MCIRDSYVVKTLNRISGIQIDMICPSHGPILKDPQRVIDLYTEWTKDVSKVNDHKKVAIVYVSAYGYTRKLAQTFEKQLSNMGYSVRLMDAQHVALGEIIDEINKSDALMVGSPTFNRDALPPIWDVMTSLSAIKQRNMPGCAFGSYGWSGEGANMLTARMKSLGLSIIDPFRVRLKPSEKELEDAVAFAGQFAELIK
jgi:flavorubredoxin